MNLSPTLPFGPQAMLSPADRNQAKLRAGLDALTLNGVWLLVIGLAVIGSGFKAARPNVFGLLLQPYLVPVLLAMPYVVLTRFQDFPTRVLIGLLVFTLSFVLTSLGPASTSVMVKFVASMLTVATVALLVRSRADLIAGTVGLTLAVGILAFRGLEDADTALGVEAIESANKNSYSLYALPALLLAGFVVLRIRPKFPMVRFLLIASGLAALAAIFMSGNRSGYLGAALIALLLVRERKFAGLLFVGMLVAAVAYYLVSYGSTEIFERRLGQTLEGNSSDSLRIELLKTCARIGLANPIAGVSPGELGNEIGRKIGGEHASGPLGPHNVFGLIMGGNGLICLSALAFLGSSLWTWPQGQSQRSVASAEFFEARKLMRYMLILWTVRGMFNDEILYNPGFCIGLGLAIGFCIVASRLTQAPDAKPGIRPQMAAAQ
jgi:O-antigen ligase